jgi:hypothetical protein
MPPPWPPLPCARCGTRAPPTLAPGTGPHALKASCAHCGRFLKWVARGCIEGKKPMGSLNRVLLVGTLSPYGVTLRYAMHGTPCAPPTLVLREQGQDGKQYSTYVDCEAWGKKAEAASALEPQQLCLFEGKLAKRKKGEQWETIVSGYELLPLSAPLASLTGRTN